MSPPSALTRPPPAPDYELDDLERLLEGTFDNYEQSYWEAQLGVDPALRHRRVTAVYRRVDLPAFEGRVFYAHKWWDGDPGTPAYRNLYVVRRDPQLNLLRLNLLSIANPDWLDGALDDDSVLASLQPSQTSAMPPECNTVWRREGDGFRIAMAGDCRLTSVSPTGEPLAITVDTRVDAQNFLYLSYGRDQRGNLLYGPKDLEPSRELRARWFDCRVRLGSVERTARLHDQGGLMVVEGAAGSVRIRLRQVRWPSHDRAPQLALVVMAGDQQEQLLDAPAAVAPAIAYASPDATRIGLSAGGYEVTCDNASIHYRPAAR
jgi:hypothetical protein